MVSSSSGAASAGSFPRSSMRKSEVLLRHRLLTGTRSLLLFCCRQRLYFWRKELLSHRSNDVDIREGEEFLQSTIKVRWIRKREFFQKMLSVFDNFYICCFQVLVIITIIVNISENYYFYIHSNSWSSLTIYYVLGMLVFHIPFLL